MSRKVSSPVGMGASILFRWRFERVVQEAKGVLSHRGGWRFFDASHCPEALRTVGVETASGCTRRAEATKQAENREHLCGCNPGGLKGLNLLKRMCVAR